MILSQRFRDILIANKTYLTARMVQPSITSFFKSTQPKKEDTKPVEEENEEDADELPKREVKTPNKRLLESDDDDDDKEDDKQENKEDKTVKRIAVESANSTPVKAEPPAKPTDAGTPVAKPLSDLVKPSMPASPLLSVEALIKKKISSGSHALHENIGVTWFKALQAEFDKPYFKKLSSFVEQQRKSKTVFPPADQVFTWTHYHTIRDTRVVIIGQDPYHGPRQAHGLSFSVHRGVAIPKSLHNIYKELSNDIPNFKAPPHGNLVGWAKQGVLMLNACLTVNQGEPNSHQGKGWENFTDATISWLSKNSNHNLVFLLWGRFAQKKSSLIEKRHKILTSAHPSPFSADSGFFGCKHFSQTNGYLRSQRLPEIDWTSL